MRQSARAPLPSLQDPGAFRTDRAAVHGRLGLLALFLVFPLRPEQWEEWE
jgi:hypothetical protein